MITLPDAHSIHPHYFEQQDLTSTTSYNTFCYKICVSIFTYFIYLCKLCGVSRKHFINFSNTQVYIYICACLPLRILHLYFILLTLGSCTRYYKLACRVYSRGFILPISIPPANWHTLHMAFSIACISFHHCTCSIGTNLFFLDINIIKLIL